MITLLILRRPGRHGLQREQLLSGARTHRDPVGDGVADQIIQRATGSIPCQPGVLHVALDQATALQCLANALGDLLHQCRKLDGCRCGQLTKHWLRAFDRHEYAVQEDHVKVNVQVQRRAEALNQRHPTGMACRTGETRLRQLIA
jgi:hypothetical protein